MKKFLLLALGGFIILSSSNAQNTWVPSVTDGFGNSWNGHVKCMIPFKGDLYAGAGDYDGLIYKTPTGNQYDWGLSYSETDVADINAMAVTNSGVGYIYVSTFSYFNNQTKISRSDDGITWTPFYIYSSEKFSHLLSYKGLGTDDSIYAINDFYMGSIIKKAAYNSNDPNDTLGTWQTIFDFSSVSPYTRVTSSLVANGKIYLGMNDATLWSTSDGMNFNQNTSVGFGFGNMNNSEITSITEFGGYIYVSTNNYSDGAQIWKSNDGVIWTLAFQFPSNIGYTKSMISAGGKLWIAAIDGNNVVVYNSSDGITISQSSTPGFGQIGNNGDYANFADFNNNVYLATRNYSFGVVANPSNTNPLRGGGGSTGAQIWRSCLGTPPTINLGADQTVCQGINITLDAGAGAVSYSWTTSDATQTITIDVPGVYGCVITDINNCSSYDEMVLTNTPAPSVNFINPNLDIPGSEIVCRGDTMSITAQAGTGLLTLFAPIPKITNDTIMDYQYTYDTLSISGITEPAGNALYSITIDSLYHTYCGDVEFRLYAPDGSSILLTGGAGGGSDNFFGTEFNIQAQNPYNSGTGPFTGSWYPDEPFYFLNGTANGNWILEIYDHAGGDQGSLKGWSLRFSEPDTVMTYSWTPNYNLVSTNTLNNFAYPTTSTTYSLTMTNSAGCSTTEPLTIVVPSTNITATSDTLCYGGTTVLSAIGPNVMWSPSATLSSSTGTFVVATPTATTMYFATDTISGCYAVDSITIYYSPQVFVTANTPQTICYSGNAMLSASGSGGTVPYQYLWSDGGTFSGTNATEIVSPSTSNGYTVYLTDALGCGAGDFTSITVTPSTDISGHVSYSGGSLANGGTVVLYNYYSFYTAFDTVAVTTLNAGGDYYFASVNYGDYIIKVFPNTSFPSLIPTYFGNTFLWDAATILVHGCTTNDTANVVMSEQTLVGGPGFIGGRIIEGPGFSRLEGDPIPGIDVKLGRNPGGQLVTNTNTNSNGYYSFGSIALNDGAANGVSYTVYVDIPGLLRDSSYVVTIDATTPMLDSLNYMVDSTTIYIVPTSSTGISNIDLAKENKFSVYPNPYKENLIVSYMLIAEADVKLEIYNLLGIKQYTFVNTQQQKGEYKYLLNDKLNSGVYFICLTIGGNSTSQRIIKID